MLRKITWKQELMSVSSLVKQMSEMSINCGDWNLHNQDDSMNKDVTVDETKIKICTKFWKVQPKILIWCEVSCSLF